MTGQEHVGEYDQLDAGDIDGIFAGLRVAGGDTRVPRT